MRQDKTIQYMTGQDNTTDDTQYNVIQEKATQHPTRKCKTWQDNVIPYETRLDNAMQFVLNSHGNTRQDIIRQDKITQQWYNTI